MAAIVQSPREKWQVNALDALAVAPACGYRPNSLPRVEPTSLAALALLSYGRTEPANQAAHWLAEQQKPDGRVSGDIEDDAPGWGTGLAILAWKASGGQNPAGGQWTKNIERGVEHLLSVKGKVMHNRARTVEHDTMIPGWPWIGKTHSWLEPTAMAVAALQSVGFEDHPRTVDGRRVLLDRILPDGGCNYGNTIVLSQPLRPHAQPTGLAMLTLARRETGNACLESTLQFLEKYMAGPVTTASASYALMGLQAHGRACEKGQEKIGTAIQETLSRHAGPGHLALGLLAGAGRESALVRICLESVE